MKRLLAILVLLSATAVCQTTLTLASGGIGVSCNAVTASTSTNPGLAGGCTSFALLTSGGTLPSTYTWQVITTGSPASVTVNLMGSLDNVTWTQVGTSSAAGTASTSSVTAYRFLGCVPATLSGGASPTVSCQISVTSGGSGGGGSPAYNQGAINAIGNSGASQTIVSTNGAVQSMTLNSANVTISFTQPSGNVAKVTLKITQAAGGNDTITWTSVKWPGGIAPVMTATASAVDWYSCFLDGTNTYCTAGQSFQ